MGYAFVSYSRRDMKHAQRLEQRIREARIDTWRDNQIPDDEPFTPRLIKALDEASCVVLVCTASSKESLWVAEEVEKARLRHLKVFALTYDRTVYVPTVPVKNHLDMRRRRDLPASLVKQLAAICGTVDQHAPRDPIGRNLAENPRVSGDFGIPVPYSPALVREMRRILKRKLRRATPGKRKDRLRSQISATHSGDFGRCVNFARCRNYVAEHRLKDAVRSRDWRLGKQHCDTCARSRLRRRVMKWSLGLGVGVAIGLRNRR
jgi:hypothetical protein